MNVSEAVETRRSIRAFTDQKIEREVIQRVLETAQRSPSGGNVQPWNAVVLTGDALERLIAEVGKVVPLWREGMTPEYDIYPEGLEGRYERDRVAIGEAMYTAMQIERGDRAKRFAWFADNFRAFGAPVLMLVHTPRYMGKPQWSDIGMWLQTVMLLLREEGLDSCAQEAWSAFGEPLRAAVDIPDDHIFFCGLSIGYRNADAPVNNFPVDRASLDEVVRWEGWQ